MSEDSETRTRDSIVVGLAQIAPVWLDREKTIEKVVNRIDEAGKRGCDLVVFGEALVPGYPFWVERTDGARFDSAVQKAMYARYLDQAVQIEAGHLRAVFDVVRRTGASVILGTVERPADRGGHSLYCSLVHISSRGEVITVHRKLMPTHEERLVWAAGDGWGLRVSPLGPFTVGALNCWENWMPLARAALVTQGEDLHVAIWPGSDRLTRDITRFAAKEARSYVVSVSGLMRGDDIPEGIPVRDAMLAEGGDVLANGGSCIAGPDGEWIVEPFTGREELVVATLDHARVREERQNFDFSGHDSRPDVTRLVLHRERQRVLTIEED